MTSVPQLGCVSQDSEPSELPKKREVSGKPEAGTFWDRFDGYDSQSLRSVKPLSEKIKEHRLEKRRVKIPHQRSPYAMKVDDRSQEETERQERCARGKAWNLASGASVQWSPRDHEDIEESDDGDDGQRRSANKRRSHGKYQ